MELGVVVWSVPNFRPLIFSSPEDVGGCEFTSHRASRVLCMLRLSTISNPKRAVRYKVPDSGATMTQETITTGIWDAGFWTS